MSAGAGNPPIAPTTLCSLSSSTLALTATRAPSCAMRVTMPSPMPCAAPVTRHRMPSSCPMSDHRPGCCAEDLPDEEVAVVDEKDNSLCNGDRQRAVRVGRADGYAVHTDPIARHLEREALCESQ